VERSARPSPAPAFVQPLELAGESSEAKRGKIAEWLGEQGLDAAVVSALDRWPGCSTSAAAMWTARRSPCLS
jgi:hypothetical protein